jgi:hypothetical protein
MNFAGSSLPAPSLRFHAIKPVKVAAPKLTKISLKPASNGMRVFHHFTAGKPKQFLFTNPKLMNAHIKRAINNEWLNPGTGPEAEAHKIDTALNV